MSGAERVSGSASLGVFRLSKKIVRPLKTTVSHQWKRIGTLLIAEDDVDFCEVLVELLPPVTSELVVARNGQEALHLVRSRQVDAVLSDIKIPVMTGL